MARLLSATETTGAMTGVDIGLIHVEQENIGWPDNYEAGPFAVSRPGTVKLTAGTKYAQAEVRIELWDDDPGVPGYPWEDYDELPFHEVPDAGALIVRSPGEEPESPGLDITGLGRARLGIAAWGRARGTHDEQLPESWLIRLWPDPRERTAIDGLARRLVKRQGPPLPLSPWLAALRMSWASWGGIAAQDINRAMRAIGRPCTRDEIEQHWRQIYDPRPDHPLDVRQDPRWDGPALGVPLTHEAIDPDIDPLYLPLREDLLAQARLHQPTLERLSELAGISLVTYDDVLRALIHVGVIAVCGPPGEERYVPSPAPPIPPEPFVSTEVLPLDFMADIVHLVYWEPGRAARWTPSRVAYRLGEPIQDVVAAFEMLRHRDRPYPPIAMERIDYPVEADTELLLRLPW